MYSDKDDNQQQSGGGNSGRDESTYVPQRDTSGDHIRTERDNGTIRKQR
jgi:hypothetical protein